MSALAYTSLDDIEKKHAELKTGFRSGKLKSIEYRKYLLVQLMYLVKENAAALETALGKDLGRPVVESRLLEVGPVVTEAMTCFSNIDKWTKPEKPAFNLTWFAMKPTIHKDPKGAVLIIGPFNYPVWSTLGPLAGALAAGNTVLIKPSESTPATSALLTELIPKYFDSDVVTVANGSIAETSKILELQWDHILFTGSGRVGRVVAAAAAKHLTPVTLELGGKSPVIVDPATVDVTVAANRILWGKVANAGQTCVAPDYVLVPRSYQETFVDALKAAHKRFYGEAGPKADGAFARIVTVQSASRIKSLLDQTKGRIVIGGETDAENKYIAPTVVADVPGDDSLMSVEIFGPVLPIIPVEDIDEAIRYVNAHDHPLALYLFSNDNALKEKVRSNTQSGGFAVNEVVIHPGVDGLPFGGTGPSGSGYHTGKFSFDLFTHLRASLDSPGWVDAIFGFRFPPYNAAKLKATSRLDKKLPPKYKAPPGVGAASAGGSKWFVFALAVAVAGVVAKRSKILPGLLGA